MMRFATRRTEHPSKPSTSNDKILRQYFQNLTGETKTILFLKNKAGKLLKTNDSLKKQTEYKPKNKAGHVVENKRPPKTNQKRAEKGRKEIREAP